MAKLYIVSLSDAERLFLQCTIKKGRGSARTTTRARILLKADAGPDGPEWTDTKIAEAVEVSQSTVECLRKRAVLEGVEAALQDRPKWENRHGKLDGEAEARLTALRCTDPPEGRTRWTLHLLADTFSEQENVSVSYELVRRSINGAPPGRQYPQTNGWNFWQIEIEAGRRGPIDVLRERYVGRMSAEPA